MAEVSTEAPARSSVTTPGVQTPDPGGVRRWAAILPELVTIGLCVPMWAVTSEWRSSVGGPGPAFYPRLLIVLLALAMVVRIVQEVPKIRKGAVQLDAPEATLEEGVEMDASLLNMRRVMVAIALSVAYVIGTLYLGWVLATFLLVIVFLWLAGKRNPLTTVPLALTFSLGMAYVFVKVVYISLPTGVGVFDQFTVRLYELLGVY
jgi:putative tricarboxylic transport membrane protein